jgi:hypothetical protein
MKAFYLIFFILFNLSVGNAFSNLLSKDDDPDVDFSLNNLVLTAGTEKDFTYSFSLTNSGTSEIQGYSMKLTFSADAELDAGDTFSLLIPLSDETAQWIGPNQTLFKNEHYYASSPGGYLPAGSWYVFAEINPDYLVPETDYSNNSTWSTNKITVNSYVIEFTSAPTVTSVTDNSFVIGAVFDPEMIRISYRIQPNGSTVPTVAEMLASDGLYPWESEITITGLGPAFAYDVYFMAEYFEQKYTSIFKVDVTTLGNPTPTLITSADELILESTSKNNESTPVLYSLTAFHLTSNVTVTPTADFMVSLDDLAYSSQLTIPASFFAQGNSQWIYVKYSPDGTPGVKVGNVVNASVGATSETIPVSVSVFDPVVGDFNGLTSLSETGWTSYSTKGYHTWTLIDLEESSPNQRVSGIDKAIQIDGTLNGFTENEDWLISPAIDLSGYIYDPTIKFRSYSSGAGESLQLKYSANYTGFGDPEVATWFDAPAEFPDVNSNEWKKTILPLFNKESRIHFAFVYTSSLTAGSRWTLDDWAITDNLVLIPSTVLTYHDVEVGTESQSQNILIKVVGYGEVTVAVSEGFQISQDNIAFSSTLLFSESEVAAGKTIYVRFAPEVPTEGLQGTLTFTAEDLSVTKNTLVGSSLMTTATELSVEFTSFIYPNPTTGEVHIDLNTLSGQQNFPVSISNNMGATLVNFRASGSSLDASLSDAIRNLQPGMYFISIQADKTIYRNKVIRE